MNTQAIQNEINRIANDAKSAINERYLRGWKTKASVTKKSLKELESLGLSEYNIPHGNYQEVVDAVIREAKNAGGKVTTHTNWSDGDADVTTTVSALSTLYALLNTPDPEPEPEAEIEEPHTVQLEQVMTPAEIEAEFGLSKGSVRQYLTRHPEIGRKADGRTWLITRADAIRIWGPHTAHTYEAKERQDGAAYRLYALSLRELLMDIRRGRGDMDREAFIRTGGCDIRMSPVTKLEIDSARQLMDLADEAFEAGYRAVDGERKPGVLSHAVPAEALAWRLVPAGYSHQTEYWRLQYLTKKVRSEKVS